jgi:hypothetical protein
MGACGFFLVAVTPCGAPTEPFLLWNAEARPAEEAVVVLPVLALHDALEVTQDDWLRGTELSVGRLEAREYRVDELRDVAQAWSAAMPGAVDVALGERWDGVFTVGRYALGERALLARAIRDEKPLEAVLSGVGRSQGRSTLVTWVDALEGLPLTAERFPGDVVETSAGYVIVRLDDEPYRVRAHVGVALVAADGEVLVRYSDEVEAVLAPGVGVQTAGLAMARELAHEVAKVWPTETQFEPYELEKDAIAWVGAR